MVVNMVRPILGHKHSYASASSSTSSNAWYTAGAWTRIAVFMTLSMVAMITPWLATRWIVDLFANPTDNVGGIVNVFEGVV